VFSVFFPVQRLETCQHEFREKLNIRHACYIIIAELSYETQYKTWLRPPLKAMEGEREKTKDRGHSAIPISYR
jgi:hypothetical protein